MHYKIFLASSQQFKLRAHVLCIAVYQITKTLVYSMAPWPGARVFIYDYNTIGRTHLLPARASYIIHICSAPCNQLQLLGDALKFVQICSVSKIFASYRFDKRYFHPIASPSVLIPSLSREMRCWRRSWIHEHLYTNHSTVLRSELKPSNTTTGTRTDLICLNQNE